jgi:hypothetical protein
VNLEDQLFSCFVGHNKDVGFFADANLVADGVDGVVFLVCVEGEVV